MTNESPASILYDVNGNPINIVLDGVVYRLQVEAKIATDQNPIPMFAKSSNVSRTSVGISGVDIELLADNVVRKGATIYNDAANATLSVGLGSAATSASSFTIIIGPGGYWEVPFGYTGSIHGFWNQVVDGYARITELY